MNDETSIRKFSWVGWLGALVLLFLASGSMIICETDGTLMKLQASGHELIQGVKLYGSKHQGKYPHTLRDLETENLLHGPLDKLLSHPIEGPEKPLGWIYLPDLSDNTPPDYPVLFTPTLQDDTGRIVRKFRDFLGKPALFPETPTRFVFCYNGSGDRMSESDFQALLKTHNITLPTATTADTSIK